MKILIDSREQRPLEFSHAYITGVVSKGLVCGDYMVMFKDGYVMPLSFERKALGDLFSTLTSGYKRFKKEIVRAREAKVKLVIVIEGSLNRILKGAPHSTVAGITILRKLITLWMRYGVEFHWFTTREEMALFIVETFCKGGREHVEKKKLCLK